MHGCPSEAGARTIRLDPSFTEITSVILSYIVGRKPTPCFDDADRRGAPQAPERDHGADEPARA